MGFDREDRDNFFSLLFKGFSSSEAGGWVSFGNLLKGFALFAVIFLVAGAGIYMVGQEIEKKNCEHLTYDEEKTYVDFETKQLIYKCDFCKKTIKYDAQINGYVLSEPSCSHEGRYTELWTFPVSGFEQRISTPIEKTPHTLDEIVTEKEEPTCKKYGREILYRCSVCLEYVGGEQIEPLGHDLVVSGFVDSTCTTTGLTNSSGCSRCDYVEYEQEVIPLKEHNYVDIVHEATYSTSGYIGKGCKDCLHPSPEVEITAPPKVSEILTYEIDMYGDYTITGVKVNDEEIIIPDYIDGIDVSSINSHAFAYNSNIKKVIIEGKLAEIQAYAFQGCSNLTEINLTNVGTIGSRAFEATNLKELYICSTIIDNYAFKDCKNLRIVEFSDDTHYINDFAFQGCSNLWSVKLSNKADASHILGSRIFDGCTSLMELIKPNLADFVGLFPKVKYEINNKDSNVKTSIYYEDECYFIDANDDYVELLLCEKDDEEIIIPETNKGGKKIILAKNSLEGIIAKKLTIRSITSEVSFVDLFGLKPITIEELTIDTLDLVPTYYINGRNASGLPTLKKIIFTPRTINYSNNGCINYCTSLEEIQLPSDGTTLLQNVYSLDYGYTFKKVVINSGEEIPQYFFEKFNKLELIVINEGVKKISAYSLFGIEGINVILPKTIENIRPFSLYNVNFFYEGSEEQWEDVAKGYDNNPIIYYYSESSPNKDGNYWYYDSDGNIAVWNE